MLKRQQGAFEAAEALGNVAQRRENVMDPVFWTSG